MKPAYDFVIKYRYVIYLIHGLAAVWILEMDKAFGAWPTVILAIFYITTGSFLFGMLMLFLKLGWNNQERPGVLAAVGAAGTLAMLMGCTTLLVMFKIFTPSFFESMQQASWGAGLLMIFGVLWDIKVKTYDKGD